MQAGDGHALVEVRQQIGQFVSAPGEGERRRGELMEGEGDRCIAVVVVDDFIATNHVTLTDGDVAFVANAARLDVRLVHHCDYSRVSKRKNLK